MFTRIKHECNCSFCFAGANEWSSQHKVIRVERNERNRTRWGIWNHLSISAWSFFCIIVASNGEESGEGKISDSVFVAVRLLSDKERSQTVIRDGWDEKGFLFWKAIESVYGKLERLIMHVLESSSGCHGTGRQVEFWYSGSLYHSDHN